jgi:poly-gamma-glutamate synthesis protein (capsule biosynthesis protein)
MKNIDVSTQSNITLNITGDLFLGRRLEPIAKQSPGSLFDAKVLDLFNKSDFNIINLESPLTNAGDKYMIEKTGPNLKAAPETIGVLDILKTNLVTLANNHIYDYGIRGLADTLQQCKNHHIDTVGAGVTFAEAKKIFYKKFRTLSIAVINVAENEWCNANESRGGANPMNLISNTRSIAEAKRSADIIILIIHGGHEHYHYPSPRMVEQYRFYAEQGASIIISHHSHFISGYEVYKNVPIFYGLGNFLFDSKTTSKGWSEGLLLNIQLNDKKEIKWTIIPFKQCKDRMKVELLEGEEKEELEGQIEHINSIISDKHKLRYEFNQLVNMKEKEVLSIVSTSYFLKFKYLRSIIRKLGLEHFFLRREQLKSILNFARCEAHRDITLKVLRNYINKEHTSDF